MGYWRLIGACLILTVAGPVRAEPNQFGVDNLPASLEMHKRVIAYASAYADKIGIGDPFWQYCQIKLTMSTANEPINGLPPYGVNYNLIKTDAELKSIIAQREVYEESYLVLCLAAAKRTLLQAEPK